jgi:TonB family protein
MTRRTESARSLGLLAALAFGGFAFGGFAVAGCAPAGPPPAAPATGSPPAAAQPAGMTMPAADPAEQKQPSPKDAAPGAASAPPPPPVGKAKADAPMLTKITQEDILAAVNQSGETFNKCYALGAGASKSYAARITVKATVGPTGTVNTVEVVSSTAKNAKVDACVVDAFKKISFNRAPGSGATVFTFPLNFEGGQAP